MTGFLTGALAATLLAAVTWVGLNEFTVTSIEKIAAGNPSLNLDGLHPTYTPDSAPEPDS